MPRLVTALAATALLLVACGGAPGNGPDGGPIAQTDLPAPVPAVVDDPAQPVNLGIDGVDAVIDPVATDVAGALLPPQDVERVGWWADSALPGSGAGTIVVTGHVDDADQGDGYAARFPDLTPGADAVLTLADGTERRYRIQEIDSTAKDGELPVDRLNSLDGPEVLALITCGGEFVGAPWGYADNVIVFATPVG
ncbi:class F sortase [Rhodococcus triatomae]|uniref:Sortase family protein n=1 Tax=Rhodococcus triatomae TaxID=300028 RepID=A0A1G8MBH2_9NOCA|nr:class F sortase [Rhodococcus triatomae]QNG18144.1 class F sortase [Rhodococcus triatomae]QNG22186.1 class F sortase [Rhodococcus triatomae]SDI65205.1 Sortase family protein [Rhodococcus triatomae]